MKSDILTLLCGYMADISIYRMSSLSDIIDIVRDTRIYRMDNIMGHTIYLEKSNDKRYNLIKMLKNCDNCKYLLGCYNLRDRLHGIYHISAEYKYYSYYADDDEYELQSFSYYGRYNRGQFINARYNDFADILIDDDFGDIYEDRIVYANMNNTIICDYDSNELISYESKIYTYDLYNSYIEYIIADASYSICYRGNKTYKIKNKDKIIFQLCIAGDKVTLSYDIANHTIHNNIIYYGDIPIFNISTSQMYRPCGAII